MQRINQRRFWCSGFSTVVAGAADKPVLAVQAGSSSVRARILGWLIAPNVLDMGDEEMVRWDARVGTVTGGTAVNEFPLNNVPSFTNGVNGFYLTPNLNLGGTIIESYFLPVTAAWHHYYPVARRPILVGGGSRDSFALYVDASDKTTTEYYGAVIYWEEF